MPRKCWPSLFVLLCGTIEAADVSNMLKSHICITAFTEMNKRGAFVDLESSQLPIAIQHLRQFRLTSTEDQEHLGSLTPITTSSEKIGGAKAWRTLRQRIRGIELDDSKSSPEAQDDPKLFIVHLSSASKIEDFYRDLELEAKFWADKSEIEKHKKMQLPLGCASAFFLLGAGICLAGPDLNITTAPLENISGLLMSFFTSTLINPLPRLKYSSKAMGTHLEDAKKVLEHSENGPRWAYFSLSQRLPYKFIHYPIKEPQEVTREYLLHMTDSDALPMIPRGGMKIDFPMNTKNIPVDPDFLKWIHLDFLLDYSNNRTSPTLTAVVRTTVENPRYPKGPKKKSLLEMMEQTELTVAPEPLR